MDQADEQFDYISRMVLSSRVMTDEFVARARPIFREEFARDANKDGKVEVVDSLYVYVARKGQ